jgi:nickel-type superoxide dismutase maturation protease
MFLIRRVNGASMHPHLPHGKLIFALRHKKPKVGDVVIVKHHRIEVLKRIHEIKDEMAYLLGDNPDESTDSRQYGWLPLKAVMGVVLGGRRDDTSDSTAEG